MGTPRVKVYTYQPPSRPSDAGTEELGQLFVPWERAQQHQLGHSRQLARALQQHFVQIPGVTADIPEEAPVRALRSVDAPAVAIEIGSFSPEADADALTNLNFLQQVSTAIAQALEAFQGGTA